MTPKTHKKIFIFLSIVIFIIFSLVLSPLIFKEQILTIANKEINKHLNAKVGFEKVNINFICSFPDASISLENIYIAGKKDFRNDTLLLSKKIQVVVNLKSLFSNKEYEINKIKIYDTKLFAHVLKDGKANWNIIKSTPTTEKQDTTTSNSNLSLKLENFQIENSDILFLQDSDDMFVELKKINLKLKGDLNSNTTHLKTKFDIDTIRLSNNNVAILPLLKLMFNATIKTNLKEQKYELAENNIKINEIPLLLNGWVQIKENIPYIDLKLKSEKVSLKSLLSLIPAIYSKSFDKIKADGKIDMAGYLKGKLTDETYPAFDFKLNVNNGWFQYPDLPKSVQAIEIKSHISNKEGNLDNMIIDIPNFSFNMGGNPLRTSIHITTPISDPNINIKADGKLNLGVIKDIYPLDKGVTLDGLLSLNINGKGRMSYLEKDKIKHFKFKGSTSLKNFVAKTNQIKQKINIDNANLYFSNHYLYLTQMNVKLGENDIRGEGRVENYLGYIFRDKTLKGRFNIASNFMNLNDFISEKELSKEEAKTSSTTSTSSIIEIPKNLDFTITSNFKKLKYQKMTFENGYARFLVKEENLNIQKMYVNAFGGKMNLSGQYSSKEKKKPFTNLNINLHQISFNPIIEQVDFLEKVVPFFQNATGRFNANLSLKALLNQDMSPDLNSIMSKGYFNTNSVQIKDDALLNQFIQKLKLNNINKFTKLRDISIAFKVEKGRLITKPFSLKMGNYKMKLNGSTGLDKTIDYNGKIRLPYKLKIGYFKEIPFKIDGTFTQPKISVDMSKVITRFIKSEKRKILDKIEKSKLKEKTKQEADKIILEAKKQGDAMIERARISGDSLVAKTKNPIAKIVTKRAAKELLKKAQKKADKIYKKALEKSKKKNDKK